MLSPTLLRIFVEQVLGSEWDVSDPEEAQAVAKLYLNISSAEIEKKTEVFAEDTLKSAFCSVTFRSHNVPRISVSYGYEAVWWMEITFLYFMGFEIIIGTEQHGEAIAAMPWL